MARHGAVQPVVLTQARTQTPERGLLCAQGAAYLLSGRWAMTLLNGALLAWHVRSVESVDVTELFRTLPKEKRARLIRLAVAAAVFALLLVRCVVAETRCDAFCCIT